MDEERTFLARVDVDGNNLKNNNNSVVVDEESDDDDNDANNCRRNNNIITNNNHNHNHNNSVNTHLLLWHCLWDFHLYLRVCHIYRNLIYLNMRHLIRCIK